MAIGGLNVDLTALGPMARRDVRFAPRAMNSAAKDSGYGREGATERLYGYTVAKSVSHKMLPPPKLPYTHNATSPALGAPSSDQSAGGPP